MAALIPDALTICFRVLMSHNQRYEGGAITWKTKVRFRHLTSRMYLSIDKMLTKPSTDAGAMKEYGTCLVAEPTANTLFFVHPVVQDTDFVPTDSCVTTSSSSSPSPACQPNRSVLCAFERMTAFWPAC